MTTRPDPDAAEAKRAKTLVRAFVFLGTILGLGLFGLVRTMLVFGATLGWVREGVGIGPFYYWLLGGAVTGLALGWGLVRARRSR
jgi:hypothetical protein